METSSVEVKISCGLFHSALLVGGDAWVWGKSDGGRLGLGLGDEASSFVPHANPTRCMLVLGSIHSPLRLRITRPPAPGAWRRQIHRRL